MEQAASRKLHPVSAMQEKRTEQKNKRKEKARGTRGGHEWKSKANDCSTVCMYVKNQLKKERKFI